MRKRRGQLTRRRRGSFQPKASTDGDPWKIGPVPAWSGCPQSPRPRKARVCLMRPPKLSPAEFSMAAAGGQIPSLGWPVTAENCHGLLIIGVDRQFPRPDTNSLVGFPKKAGLWGCEHATLWLSNELAGWCLIGHGTGVVTARYQQPGSQHPYAIPSPNDQCGCQPEFPCLWG